MKPKAIKQDLWQITLPTPFRVGDVNIYLLKTDDDRLMLVDAGPKTSQAKKELQSQLASLGYRISDISRVFLTHHHPDHTGGIEFFPESTEIIGHWRNRFWLKMEKDFKKTYLGYFDRLIQKMGLPDMELSFEDLLNDYLIYAGARPLTAEIDEGDQLPFLQGWQVIYVPGHARSHLALWDEGSGHLIGGDVLLGNISSNPILEGPYYPEDEPSDSLASYRKSLEKLSELEISTVLPGHGQPFSDPVHLIEKRLQEQLDRRETIYGLLEEAKTAYEVGAALFPRAIRTQIDLVLSEVLGYLTWLRREERVDVIDEAGVNYYKQQER